MAESASNNISKQSIKSIAESCGNAPIDDDCSQVIADEVNARLREVIQDGLKFMRHSKRDKLTRNDIDLALKFKSIEPVYGFTSRDFVPFRYASGGGRSIFFQEDKEFNLTDLIASQEASKVPLDNHTRAHWLSIDGTQPLIPENPDPDTLHKFKRLSSDDSLDDFIPKKVPALFSLSFQDNKLIVEKKAGKEVKSKEKVEDTSKASFLKPLSGHELSLEQQLFFREITEACVSNSEEKRKKALECLQYDPGLYQLLPRFSRFISEGVRANIHETEDAVLIYLLRMMDSLLQNETLNLEKYLHELIPTALSCVVNKQIASEDPNNRLVIQHYAASLIYKICSNKIYNSPVNNVQSRITQTMANALQEESLPLHTYYGAIYLMIKLCSNDALKRFLLPLLKEKSDLIECALNGQINSDKLVAEKLRDLLVQHLALILPISNDSLDTVREKYGYIGCIIVHNAQYLKQTNSRGMLGETPFKYSIPSSIKLTTTKTNTGTSPSTTTNSITTLSTSSNTLTSSKQEDFKALEQPAVTKSTDISSPNAADTVTISSGIKDSRKTDNSDGGNDVTDSSMSEISEKHTGTSNTKIHESLTESAMEESTMEESAMEESTMEESAMEIESSSNDVENANNVDNSSSRSKYLSDVNDHSNPDDKTESLLNVLATSELAKVELMEESSSDSEEFVDSTDVALKSNLDSESKCKSSGDIETETITKNSNRASPSRDSSPLKEISNSTEDNKFSTKDDVSDSVKDATNTIIKTKSDENISQVPESENIPSPVTYKSEKTVEDKLPSSSSSSDDDDSQEYLPISTDNMEETADDTTSLPVMKGTPLSSDQSDISPAIPSVDNKRSNSPAVDAPMEENLSTPASSKGGDSRNVSEEHDNLGKSGNTSPTKPVDKPLSPIERLNSCKENIPTSLITADDRTTLSAATGAAEGNEKMTPETSVSADKISASLATIADKHVTSPPSTSEISKATGSHILAEDKMPSPSSPSRIEGSETVSPTAVDDNTRLSDAGGSSPSASPDKEDVLVNKTEILPSPSSTGSLDEKNSKPSISGSKLEISPPLTLAVNQPHSSLATIISEYGEDISSNNSYMTDDESMVVDEETDASKTPLPIQNEDKPEGSIDKDVSKEMSHDSGTDCQIEDQSQSGVNIVEGKENPEVSPVPPIAGNDPEELATSTSNRDERNSSEPSHSPIVARPKTPDAESKESSVNTVHTAASEINASKTESIRSPKPQTSSSDHEPHAVSVDDQTISECANSPASIVPSTAEQSVISSSTSIQFPPSAAVKQPSADKLSASPGAALSSPQQGTLETRHPTEDQTNPILKSSPPNLDGAKDNVDNDNLKKIDTEDVECKIEQNPSNSDDLKESKEDVASPSENSASIGSRNVQQSIADEEMDVSVKQSEGAEHASRTSDDEFMDVDSS
ncbi:Transcription initiation factor TFIID subunit 6 [Trichoplax sp. H2]|nr:Transcription initiation factor TFIID subunit 6 [Trichoplax sp. H2]|eukprot:RDD40493.1 Transcription initiation factor TFIID subunit 6 [Trichoplax sp. H2]